MKTFVLIALISIALIVLIDSIGQVVVPPSSGGGSGGGGAGTLPMNSSQFNTNSPVSIIDGYAATNSVFRSSASAGHSRAFMADTNVLVITNRLVGIRTESPTEGLTVGGGQRIHVGSGGLTNEIANLWTGTLADTEFGLMVGGSTRWQIENSPENYAFVPGAGISNTYSVGLWSSTISTGWVNRIEAKTGLRIGIGSDGVAFEYTNAVKTSNIFRFSITNAAAGQFLKIHNVENLSGGQVVIVITNSI